MAAGIAALASAVANRNRWSHALAAAATGVAGYGTYGLLRVGAVSGATVATACAAVVVGVLARVLGQRLRAPSLVLAVPALSALLPGLTIFRGMSQLAQGDTGPAVGTLLSATTTALAIAAGIVLGDFLAAPADRRLRRRPPGD